MGFSLKRVLAGAVVGGAHAAGEVFDAQLKEQASNRARELEIERQKEFARYQDELTADRELRKEEHLSAREEKKRGEYRNVISETSAKLKADGIKIGSAEGQDAIAQAFIAKGYPEFGNTFVDNAQKARDADDKKELRKIELANSAETHRHNREMRAEAKEANAILKRSESDKMADKMYRDTLDSFETPTFEDGKKAGVNSEIKNFIANNTFELAKVNPHLAAKKAMELGEMVGQVRSENPKASNYEITQLAETRWREAFAAGKKAADVAITGKGMIDFSSARGAPQAETLSKKKGSQPEVPIKGAFNNLGETETVNPYGIINRLSPPSR